MSPGLSHIKAPVCYVYLRPRRDPPQCAVVVSEPAADRGRSCTPPADSGVLALSSEPAASPAPVTPHKHQQEGKRGEKATATLSVAPKIILVTWVISLWFHFSEAYFSC